MSDTSCQNYVWEFQMRVTKK